MLARALRKRAFDEAKETSGGLCRLAGRCPRRSSPHQAFGPVRAAGGLGPRPEASVASHAKVVEPPQGATLKVPDGFVVEVVCQRIQAAADPSRDAKRRYLSLRCWWATTPTASSIALRTS